MSGADIRSVRGRRIYDSRGHPTVEVEIAIESGAVGRAAAPAGASCGSGEAVELRDGGSRFDGKGVDRALTALSSRVAPALHGLDVRDQSAFDAVLDRVDGTPNFAAIGGNVAVAVSLAGTHAAAAHARVPLWAHLAATSGAPPLLPLPEVQIFGGGAHAARRVDLQDFMVMVPGADTFAEAMAITAGVYHAAGALMEERGLRAGVADEGGWWPAFGTNEQALDMLMLAIERVGEVPGERVVISLDIAATQFRGPHGYRIDDRHLDAPAFSERIAGWLERYPIVAVEDPLAEDEVAAFTAFGEAHGSHVLVVGDDFLVTSAERIAAAGRACNTALIKVNQAGTVSRAFQAVRAARAAGWRTIVSARSGETEDVSISHLAVGWGADVLKVGSIARSERTAKWNECLRIADALGDAAFMGGRPLAGTWWHKRGSDA